ncbi:MAG: GNAT family N-acetyltransferase, partial [Devosia sp.]|nr:GNAT family N-acetyltransferase [Devosia sp.]
MPDPLRLVCLVSGGGTTLQNLLDRSADGMFPATVAGVVSSRADAFGVERARRAGVPVLVEPRGPGFAERVWAAVRSFTPDLVCLAGWLHLLPIPADLRNRVLNIHPSLLPAFGGKGMYGRHVHEAVLAYGAKMTGCTVHFVTPGMDEGPTIAQASVAILAGDTPDILGARVLVEEHKLYPRALAMVAASLAGTAPLIRRLGAADAAAYRAIRLEALQDAPTAFGSSYEAECTRDLAEFESTVTRNYIAGAWLGGALVGTAGFHRLDATKVAHRGNIWGVYVRPEARGHGVARALIADVLAFARTQVEQ